MSFVRLQKLVTYLLAALGLFALTFGGEIPLVPLLVLAAGFVASWFAEGPIIHRPWWQRGFNVLTVVALVGQVMRGMAGGGGWLSLAMEFAGLLTISRLCNRRDAADYQQIAMLSLIQLIAATVLTTDLGYAAVFVAFAIVTPWVLTFAHLRREIERNYPHEPETAGQNDLARVLASRRIVDPSFLLWTALLSVPMLMMTVALFALFPRIGLGMLNLGNNRGQHVSGFGDDVELGGFGVIRDDPTVVLRVTTSRPLPLVVARRYLRLRGTAFDQYDGRRWTRSSDGAVKMSPIGEYYPLKRMPKREDLTLRIILDRLDEPVIFVPTGAVGLRIPERGLPGAAQRVTLTRRHGFDIRYASSEDMGIVYEAEVTTALGPSDVPVDRELDDARYLAIPPGHERVVALALELTRGIADPAEKAKRLERYLKRDGGYDYSLELPDVRGKVPLVAFMFDVRRGHCEYFSTALAIMLRAVGIPARNVTGYLGGEFNTYGGYYAIRQADAHSWVEALLPDRGWVLVEPTPPTRDEFTTSDLFRELRAMADAARAYWMTHVVAYDLRAQLRAIRQMRDFFRELASSGKRTQDDEAEAAKGGRVLSRSTLGWMVAGVALLGALWFAARRLRRRRSLVALSSSARAAQKLYRQLEAVLAKRGLARPPHVTPEAHARALREQGFPAADAVIELTDAYVESRFGSYDLEPPRLRALSERLRDVKRAA
jgi:protein-glutamine gamma-glutamyltransferase